MPVASCAAPHWHGGGLSTPSLASRPALGGLSVVPSTGERTVVRCCAVPWKAPEAMKEQRMRAVPEQYEAWAQAPALTVELSTKQASRLRRSCQRRVRRLMSKRRRQREREGARRLRELRDLMTHPDVNLLRERVRNAARPCPAPSPRLRRVGTRRRGAGRPRGMSRSCARSGDSGDSSGSSDAEPSPARRNGRRACLHVLAAGRAEL